MKKILSLFLLSLCLISFSGCKSKKGNDFILGLDASFPPMGYTDVDGTIIGYDIDLAKEVCNRLGLNFIAKPIKWEAKEFELSSGSIDCIWNGFTIDDARIEAMSMTPAYLNNNQVLVVRADDNIKTLADVKGKVIAVQAGSSAEEAIKDTPDFEKSIKNLSYYEDNLTAMTDLLLGGVDGVVMDSVVAEFQIKTSKDPLVVLDETLASESYGIGFAKSEEGAALRDKVWASLEEMAKDGTIAEISKKWFDSDISVVGK